MKTKQYAYYFLINLLLITGLMARDQIKIVGSSTVFPFATAVAENFGRDGDFKTPIVESTGSGGGLKLFCSGIGSKHPDITNASRKIKPSEINICRNNGITPIPVQIGYDGIVLANAKSAKRMRLTRRDIFMALAKKVPVNGRLVDNPYQTWQQVNPSLPNIAIEVLGPPPTSGTRDAFSELAMGEGAKTFADIKTLRGLKVHADIKKMMMKLAIPMAVFDGVYARKGEKISGKDIFKMVAYGIREDGAFIEAGENDNLIVQKLSKNPNAIGIFGFSFLEENRNIVQGSLVDGYDPSFENISSGRYPISRSLYFYVKKQHIDVIPGIREFVNEFADEQTWGDEGYLADKGLIPMGRGLRHQVKGLVLDQL